MITISGFGGGGGGFGGIGGGFGGKGLHKKINSRIRLVQKSYCIKISGGGWGGGIVGELYINNHCLLHK